MIEIHFKGIEDLLNELISTDRLREFKDWTDRVKEIAPLSPFYEQVMLLRGVKPEQIDKYKENPIEVSAGQMRNLRSLSSDELQNNPGLHIDYKKASEVFKAPGIAVDSFSRDGRIVRKGHIALGEFFGLTEEFTDASFILLSGEAIGITPMYMEGLHEEFSEFLADFDFRRNSLMVDVKNYFSLVRKSAKGKNNPELTKIVEPSIEMSTERALNDFLGLKIERTKALRRINTDFSRAYFEYSVALQGSIEELCDREHTFECFPLGFSELAKFIGKDNELYQEMLGSFRVKSETVYVQPRPNQVAKPAGKKSEITVKIQFQETKPAYKPTPQENLRSAIFDNNSAEFTRDTKLRVEYFVEEAAQSYNGQLDEVAKSFSKLKFGRKLRSKDRPDEMQLRTFFDDIYLNYARQGKVPSYLDLGRLYEENCVVSSNK